jgi:hypothetical protein
VWISLIAFASLAYETDQLTDRGPLSDARSLANAWMDELITDSVDTANRRTGCTLDSERAHHVLVRTIGRTAATRTFVSGRGLIRGMGHGGLGAYLETAEVDRREAVLFDQVKWWDSVVLANAGGASTVQVAGVLVGTDKIDHFLATGYAYWRKSRRGDDPGRALRYGTRTERGLYGLATSMTFSYADLAANVDGFVFYDTLLGPSGVVTQTPSGCLRQHRPFDWAEWVRPDWDEVVNPSVYSARVQRRIWETLDARAEDYCAVWRRAKPSPTYARPPYVSGKAPPRSDPFGLAARCAED